MKCKECSPTIKILIAATSKAINDAKGEFKCSRDPTWRRIAVIKFYVHPFFAFYDTSVALSLQYLNYTRANGVVGGGG